MISTHQELFEQWYNASKSLIYEFSGSIYNDLLSLYEEAKEYSSNHGLDISTIQKPEKY